MSSPRHKLDHVAFLIGLSFGSFWLMLSLVLPRTSYNSMESTIWLLASIVIPLWIAFFADLNEHRKQRIGK